ncbi:growth-regulating factor 1-like isoform X2 [Mangifera indica]|uniref:growth-regulating factor 1-like isoform X2 n=1 Tax=Mangifera indica TaxID=29780 RepID=UPI001CFB9B68|nr:growth-regulating factor 1-like isoform X2 [Mangifera indica]
MDFGILGLDGLVVGPENGAPSSVSVSVPPETMARVVVGSRFSKQERSGSGEDDRGALKIAKTGDFSSASKAMPLQQGIPLLRSNPIFSASGETSRQPGQMLSFRSNKPETALFNRTNAFLERSPQPTVLPYYNRTPLAYPRPAGDNSGGLNVVMHGAFPGVKGPFTPSQWIELEHQALIYKYISLNVPVPPNLLIPIRKSVQSFGMPYSATGSFSPNSYGWGPFHLGYASNTDPEPGRCRRTDGKKWRCSRDAVADQKYCERHINRGRHRSRKPVEGQTGHAASGTTNSMVVPMTSSMSTSMITSDGASNSLAITQHQFKNLQPGAAAKSTADACVSRVQDSRSVSMMSSTIDLKSNESTFPVTKQDIPFEKSSQSVFGFLCSDSLLNPSQRSSYSNSKNYGGSFLDFNDSENQDQNPLRKFMDDWPKDESSRSILTWPEELKSDWTQLSMSIPIASEFSSSSSPNREKLALSPLRLYREFEPTQVDLGLNNDLNEPTQKLTNWIPKSWGTSMCGPLGEALTNTSNNVVTSESSSLNMGTEGWDSSQQLGSSPTGVLQKSAFCSLSNSSSGSSSMADNKKTHDGGSIGDASTLLSSSSIPSL